MGVHERLFAAWRERYETILEDRKAQKAARLATLAREHHALIN